MWRLAAHTLRVRKGGFLATFIAMFFGTTIVLACGGVMETGVSADAPPQRLAGAPVVLAGDRSYALPKENPGDPEEDTHIATLPEQHRIDAGLAGRIERLPGVRDAIGDVSFTATVFRDGRPAGEGTAGHGWASAALTPYSLTSGAPPVRPGEVVLDESVAGESGVSVGDRIELGAGGSVAGYRVTGIAMAPDDREISEPALFVSGPEAQRLSGHPGRVDAIGVLTDPGAETEVRQRLHETYAPRGLVALSGDERGTAEFPEVFSSTENLIIVGAVSGSMAIMVAMFVVSSTLSLSVRQRQREVALLRAIGTTPGQIRWMVLGEALAVSALAIIAGLIPGFLLGRVLFAAMSGSVVPEAVEFHAGPIPAVVAAGATLLTAVVSALVAVRRAATTRPTEALMDAGVQRRWLSRPRLLSAIVFLAGGVALAVVTMTVMDGPLAQATAGPAVITWAVGIALLSPGLTRLCIRALGRPVRAMFGLTGYLATMNARARTIRMAAAVTPIMLATGVATANLYLQTTAAGAAEEAYTAHLRADAVLTSSVGGLPAGLLEDVRRLPGVSAASGFVTSTGFIERPYDGVQSEDGTPLQGISARGIERTTELPVTGGTLAALRGNTVALPREHAAELGLGVGDTITMRFGDNTSERLRIVALYAADAGFETILLPGELLAAHTTSGLPSQLLVRAQPDADPDGLTGALEDLAARQAGIQVADAGELGAAYRVGLETQAFVNYLMIGAIVAYTALSVVNTLVMATTNRRREFGLQRLTGCTGDQVMRMMTAEAGIVAVAGVVLGTVASLVSLIPFSIAVSGWPLPSGPLWMYLAVIVAAGGLTFAATLVPTRRALRSAPAEAARDAE